MDVLKEVLDHLSDAMIVIDGYGQVVLFNQEAQRVQQSVSERKLEIGANYLDLEPAERRAVVENILDTVRRQNKPVKNFAELRTPFGTTVYLELNYVPVAGADQQLRYINIITQDITSRKIFEQRLRAARADLRNVLEQAHAVVVSLDARGYLVDWNAYATELTGWSKRDILSRRLDEILVDPGSCFQQLLDDIAHNRAVARLPITLRTANDKHATVKFSLTPRLNANGKVIGATLVGQAHTETPGGIGVSEVTNGQDIVQLVREPGRKEKQGVDMRSHLISIASHEFRSPLSSIDYAANFIKQHAGKLGRKKLNEKVAVIEKHVSYMSDLLEDVLRYDRAAPEEIKVVREAVDVTTFVNDTVEEITAACKGTHTITVSMENPGTVQADGKLLRNVVSNLLTNAVKFSPARDEVWMRVSQTPETLVFEVVDKGIGIPEHEVDRIFEPFVRGTGTDDIQGTGLGLSIARRAVTLLQGTLQVESREGEGSTFRVTIPID